MNDDRIARLMNDVLDGTADPLETAELKAILARDPEARNDFDELLALQGRLSRLAMIEPPADLKQRVLAALPSRGAAERGGWLSALRTTFQARPALRLGYAFAGGLAAGIVGFAVLSGSLSTFNPREAGPFSGTMAPPSDLNGFQALDRARLDVPGGTVGVETHGHPGGVAVRVEAGSSEPLLISVTYDATVFRAVALRQERPEAARVQLVAGACDIRSAGASRFHLFLERRGPEGARGASPQPSIRIQVGTSEGVRRAELRASRGTG